MVSKYSYHLSAPQIRSYQTLGIFQISEYRDTSKSEVHLRTFVRRGDSIFSFRKILLRMVIAMAHVSGRGDVVTKAKPLLEKMNSALARCIAKLVTHE